MSRARDRVIDKRAMIYDWDGEGSDSDCSDEEKSKGPTELSVGPVVVQWDWTARHPNGYNA